MFPNPVSNELHLINIDLKSKIKIIDMMGRKHEIKVIPNYKEQTLKINLSHLQSGTYIIQIFSENGMAKSLKVMKQ